MWSSKGIRPPSAAVPLPTILPSQAGLRRCEAKKAKGWAYLQILPQDRQPYCLSRRRSRSLLCRQTPATMAVTKHNTCTRLVWACQTGLCKASFDCHYTIFPIDLDTPARTKKKTIQFDVLLACRSQQQTQKPIVCLQKVSFQYKFRPSLLHDCASQHCLMCTYSEQCGKFGLFSPEKILSTMVSIVWRLQPTQILKLCVWPPSNVPKLSPCWKTLFQSRVYVCQHSTFWVKERV